MDIATTIENLETVRDRPTKDVVIVRSGELTEAEVSELNLDA